MGIINKYHAIYLTKGPIQEFFKKNEIKNSGYSFEDLLTKFNNLYDEDELDKTMLEDELYKWILQGRKKVLFTFLEEHEFTELNTLPKLDETIKSKLSFSDEIQRLQDIDTRFKNNQHLIEVRYYRDDRRIDENKYRGEIDKAIFIYAYIVKQVVKESSTVTSNNIIVLPVHVILDFKNNEISSRVSAKNNIYYMSDDKADEVKLARSCMKSIMVNLGITLDNENRTKQVEEALYSVHKNITELPEELSNKIELIDDIIKDFIEEACEKIEVVINEMDEEELNASIKSIFTKQLIKNIPKIDREKIFLKDKFGYSTGILTSASSLSSVKHISPGGEPIHSLPDYQNTKSIVDEKKAIDKDIIYWYSIVRNDPIRSKLFVSDEGYGIISFEEYTFEEDINNVFSKIRESK